MKPMFRMPAKEDYLKAALRVAHWLRANAERTETGIHWFEDPMHPEGETVMGEFSVYSGMPGPILFLLELSEITGDFSWREEACLAADYLLANFDEGRKMQTDMGVPGSEIGPISGTAGLSFAFTELGKATGEQKYLDFAAAETEKIASLAKRIGEGSVSPAEFPTMRALPFICSMRQKPLGEKTGGHSQFSRQSVYLNRRLKQRTALTSGVPLRYRTSVSMTAVRCRTSFTGRQERLMCWRVSLRRPGSLPSSKQRSAVQLI